MGHFGDPVGILCHVPWASNKKLWSSVEDSWCREGVREGTQGYQLRLETALVLLCTFLIIGVELGEARGDRKGGWRAWGWGEAHGDHFPPSLLLCSLLGLYLWNAQGTLS